MKGSRVVGCAPFHERRGGYATLPPRFCARGAALPILSPPPWLAPSPPSICTPAPDRTPRPRLSLLRASRGCKWVSAPPSLLSLGSAVLYAHPSPALCKMRRGGEEGEHACEVPIPGLLPWPADPPLVCTERKGHRAGCGVVQPSATGWSAVHGHLLRVRNG
ncbi:hypothetical protein EI94DRAFT_1736945 [Lactarius quietus]|nr:hypothetical protein EI94DRAFT_1736945 [Lactarius quietus]